MIRLWYTQDEAAKRLKVVPDYVRKLKGIRTEAGKRKKGEGGRPPVLYLRTDVEALRQERIRPVLATKKVAAKKRRRPETPNQRKVKKANQALKKPNARHHDESVDKLFAKFVVEIKKVDPTISVVRVELARKSIEVLGGE